MKAIRMPTANFVFNPPAGGNAWCDPVWVERTRIAVDGGGTLPCIKLTYELDPNDLVYLNHGARIELTIMGERMPPVSMGITPATVLGPPVPPVIPGPKPVG